MQNCTKSLLAICTFCRIDALLAMQYYELIKEMSTAAGAAERTEK